MQQYKNDLDYFTNISYFLNYEDFTMSWLISGLKTKQQKTPKITEDIIY